MADPNSKSSHDDTMATSISHFNKTPWCKALIADPKWEPVTTVTRIAKRSTEDAFFAETLASERTIRQILTLYPREGEVRECRTIMELGPSVNGHPGLAHGGFVATVLDEILGLLISMKFGREWEEANRRGENPRLRPIFTAYLNTSYKKPVPTPSVVLCIAKFERQEGKKIFVSGTVEDGSGTVYAKGEALFIETKPKL